MTAITNNDTAKIIKIIESCETYDQFRAAEKWVDRLDLASSTEYINHNVQLIEKTLNRVWHRLYNIIGG